MSVAIAQAPLSPTRNEPAPFYSEPLAPLSPGATHEQLAPTGRSHTPGGYVIPLISVYLLPGSLGCRARRSDIGEISRDLALI